MLPTEAELADAREQRSAVIRKSLFLFSLIFLFFLLIHLNYMEEQNAKENIDDERKSQQSITKTSTENHYDETCLRSIYFSRSNTYYSKFSSAYKKNEKVHSLVLASSPFDKLSWHIPSWDEKIFQDLITNSHNKPTSNYHSEDVVALILKNTLHLKDDFLNCKKSSKTDHCFIAAISTPMSNCINSKSSPQFYSWSCLDYRSDYRLRCIEIVAATSKDDLFVPNLNEPNRIQFCSRNVVSMDVDFAERQLYFVEEAFIPVASYDGNVFKAVTQEGYCLRSYRYGSAYSDVTKCSIIKFPHQIENEQKPHYAMDLKVFPQQKVVGIIFYNFAQTILISVYASNNVKLNYCTVVISGITSGWILMNDDDTADSSQIKIIDMRASIMKSPRIIDMEKIVKKYSQNERRFHSIPNLRLK